MAKTILALDQSTSASKAFLLNQRAEIIARSAYPHAQRYPAPNYVEQDADQIWRDCKRALDDIMPGEKPLALALCNQRETLIFWDKMTGEPLGPAIGWQDTRAADWCAERKDESQWIQELSGLPLSPYYSAAKIAAVLKAHPDWTDRALLGTMDSYLIYRLTNGRAFKTDVSNASRTQLMNLRTLTWDDELCAFFGVPRSCLPEIESSDAVFGETDDSIPIIGVMGDSQASLFGQNCVRMGMAKATYGTGSSVMVNIGEAIQQIPDGLTQSVGFRYESKTHYVLEGNVISCADTLTWLVNELGLYKDVDELCELAAGAKDAGGVSLIPAFSGLGAPYNDESARALLFGMSRGTTKKHIAYAALESIAQQDAAVLRAMGIPLKELRVDGGPTKNAQLMQLQADLLNCPVQCTAQSELSAVGAALMAGRKLGLYTGHPLESAARYEPAMSENERNPRLSAWQTAVARAMNR